MGDAINFCMKTYINYAQNGGCYQERGRWRTQTIVRGYLAMPIVYIDNKLIVSMLLLLDMDYNLGLLY